MDVDATVRGGVRRESPRGLLQLPLAARALAAARLVPGDGHVNEPLEEVTLLGGRGAPCKLELLVSGEELSVPDQIEAAEEPRFEHGPRH